MNNSDAYTYILNNILEYKQMIILIHYGFIVLQNLKK